MWLMHWVLGLPCTCKCKTDRSKGDVKLIVGGLSIQAVDVVAFIGGPCVAPEDQWRSRWGVVDSDLAVSVATVEWVWRNQGSRRRRRDFFPHHSSSNGRL
ncbi:hypothetical protein ACFX15_001145 [Malus domestica]